MSSYDTSVAAPPKTVVWSYRLYLVAAALGIVGIVLTLVLLPASIDAAVQLANRAAQGQDTNGVDLAGVTRGATIASAIIGVVIALVLSILTFVFARKLLQGKNWARIVLLIFAILQVAGVLSAVGVGAVQFIVVIVAAILSFLPRSSAWFRSMKAARPVA